MLKQEINLTWVAIPRQIINAPRGCAWILIGNMSAKADQNPAPRLASEILNMGGVFYE